MQREFPDRYHQSWQQLGEDHTILDWQVGTSDRDRIIAAQNARDHYFIGQLVVINLIWLFGKISIYFAAHI